ncbi:Asp-tRNA(Asn)/Glu-tRNA(Gln) amidotransferase subunit GatA [Candidatus Deianiraea vastatrix]|nr:Asp-tRNA(Asn)/Glu-tRNA(Gln) amidotransferase subunit GatA [Candidatus Deianiraea vastatrix]
MNNKNKTLLEVLGDLRAKKISALELTKDFLVKIKESKLNAFITICEDLAIESAKKSDEKIAKNEGGKLEGVPLAIKDLFCTNGVKTTAGSKILENFVPNYESDVTQKLKNEGYIMLGKTNMDEFAMGSTNLTSYFGACINPWKSSTGVEKNLVPGGSSGGSAAAVAAGLCLGATGSDTGGSIRQPASFCGIVGVKPSYGICSRYGMVAYASSLDQAGFFAQNVDDAAYLMEVIAGQTANDSMMYDAAKYDFTSNINSEISGMTIGIPKQFQSDALMPEIAKNWQDCIEYFKKLGVKILDIELPNVEKSINTYYIIAPSEACSNLSRYDGIRFGFGFDEKVENIDEYYTKTRSLGFGQEVKRRIMTGNYILSSKRYDEYYIKALKVRRVIKNEFDAAFAKVDAILCPATPNVAFGIDDKNDDPIKTYLNDIYTVPVNLAGLPGISVPTALSNDGLPIGMQIICQRREDAKMYQIAKWLEKFSNIT